MQGVSDKADFFTRNIKFMLILVSYLFTEEVKRSMIKKGQLFDSESDSSTIQTNMLIAIQSKIFEHNYRRSEGFKREEFVMCFIKAILRVVLKNVRENQFEVEEGKQILVDMSFVCELLNELVDKEDESIVSGFYHSIVDAIIANTNGDPSLKNEQLQFIYQKKRSGFKVYN